MNHIKELTSPLGLITLASNGSSLTGLWFNGQKHFPTSINIDNIKEDCAVFDYVKLWLDAYFMGKRKKFDFSLELEGTEFQKAVWEKLLNIPYGKTVTYGYIAKQLEGKKKTCAQAVGNAVGHNPISIIIPCHRVIGTNGNLTGYAGGLNNKKRLLQIEGIEVDNNNYILTKKLNIT